MNSPHVCVLASAGTGKTHTLSSRYIGLLARKVEPRTILATTFTRKAAGEILGRVLERLAEAAGDDAKLRLLNDDIGVTLGREACRDLTAKIARQIHRLHIGTIDSFFAQVMKGFALDLDVPPGLAIVDDEPDEEIRSQAVVRAIEGAGGERLAVLMRMLASGQLKRAVHDAVLQAVKTAYMAYLPSRYQPEAWEVFGQGARAPEAAIVSELVRRVRALPVPQTGKHTPNINFATNLDQLARELEARHWSGVLKLGLVRKVIDGEDTFNRAEITPDARACIGSAIEAARGGVLALLRDRNIATRDFMARFDGAYQQIKAERGVMRFEDVPRAILEAGASDRKDELYYRLDGRINHLLLDEFQDTSLEQFEILRPMLEEMLATSDGSRTVLCVGDVKQSLYSWRGAEPELLPALARRWPQFAQETLSTNRRSSPAILEAVNAVFGGIAANAVVSEFGAASRLGEGFVTHEAHHSALPGEVKVSVPPDGDDDETGKATARARFVAQRVEVLRQEAPGASIAVLTRTNKPIPQLIFELRERGIPAVGERGNPLTDTPAPAAAISALHLADHPWDLASLFHVATSPLGAVLGVRWRDSRDLNRMEGQWIASRLRMKLERDGLRAVLERWQRRLSESMDLMGHARFDQLVDLAAKFEDEAQGRPEDFVRLVRRKSVEPPGMDRGGVRVMTIHAAKGLEFDAVVLPELDKSWSVKPGSVLIDRRDEQGRRDALSPIAAVTMCPSDECRAVEPTLNDLHEHTLDRIVGEELSSLYVAMTRARRYLELVMPEIKGDLKQPSAHRVLWAAIAPTGYRTASAWLADLKEEPIESAPERDVKWAKATEVPAGRLGRRSPSSLEGGPRVDLGELWRAARPADEPAAKDRGTALHAMFEAIEWLGSGVPERARLSAATAGLGIRVSEAWIDEFLHQLRGEVAGVLTRARYAGRPGDLDVRREWSFAIRERSKNGAEYILTGIIDRLVLGVERGRPAWAEILDFKSDDVRDQVSIASSVEHYRPQIEAYKRAVASIHQLPPERVAAFLVFSGPGCVVPV